MRVPTEASRCRAAPRPREEFSAALGRARDAESFERRARAGAATRSGPRRPERSEAGDPRPAAGGERVAASGDAPRAAASPAPASAPAGTAEIAALARTLPAAVAAARTQHGAVVALSFGRSLDVELRSGPAGVEVVLRPEPRLARAAEAELPRVVAALRSRGVPVASAEVRAPPGSAGALTARGPSGRTAPRNGTVAKW
jgi:hypothetical protein